MSHKVRLGRTIEIDGHEFEYGAREAHVEWVSDGSFVLKVGVAGSELTINEPGLTEAGVTLGLEGVNTAEWTYETEVRAVAPKRKRAEVLDSAAALISGERDQSYGDASESFARIAAIWGAVLGIEVSAEQVAMCLAGLKLSRLSASPDHLDSWVDLAGYAALGAEVADA